MDLLHDLILKLMLTAKGRAKGIRIYLFFSCRFCQDIQLKLSSPEMKAKDFYLTKKFFFFLHNELKKQFTKLNQFVSGPINLRGTVRILLGIADQFSHVINVFYFLVFENSFLLTRCARLLNHFCITLRCPVMSGGDHELS